jgi:predicted DNA-binding protein
VEQELIDVAHPPLSIDMNVGPQRERVRVEISGRTEVFIPEWPATVIPHSSEQAFRISPKFFLRGFLDQVFMTAVGEHVDKPWTVIVNPAEEALRYKHKNCIRQFKPLDMQTSRQYLRGVIEDMLTQVHAYYMPVEVVFEHMRSEESVAQISERKRRSRWEATSSDHGPIHDPERYQAPDDAQKIIQKRYGLYFDQLKGKR